MNSPVSPEMGIQMDAILAEYVGFDANNDTANRIAKDINEILPDHLVSIVDWSETDPPVAEITIGVLKND